MEAETESGPVMELAQTIAGARRASVVAAAGCGKTEQTVVTVKYLAEVGQLVEGRLLILNPTDAGVEAP